MKLRKFKSGLCILFMGIFITKVFLSLAPVFVSLNNKTVNKVIIQLEQETKAEKEDPDKSAIKEKKVFDEEFVSLIECAGVVPAHLNVLHNQQRCLYLQTYHPLVPTPPPNA